MKTAEGGVSKPNRLQKGRNDKRAQILGVQVGKIGIKLKQSRVHFITDGALA